MLYKRYIDWILIIQVSTSQNIHIHILGPHTKIEKNIYTSELPSDCTQHFKFFDIYYKGDDDIYQDAVIKSDYKSSFHDINKEDQGRSKNKEGQKLSDTFSTRKKNKPFCGTPHIYNKCPTVLIILKIGNNGHGN